MKVPKFETTGWVPVILSTYESQFMPIFLNVFRKANQQNRAGTHGFIAVSFLKTSQRTRNGYEKVMPHKLWEQKCSARLPYPESSSLQTSAYRLWRWRTR